MAQPNRWDIAFPALIYCSLPDYSGPHILVPACEWDRRRTLPAPSGVQSGVSWGYPARESLENTPQLVLVTSIDKSKREQSNPGQDEGDNAGDRFEAPDLDREEAREGRRNDNKA